MRFLGFKVQQASQASRVENNQQQISPVWEKRGTHEDDKELQSSENPEETHESVNVTRCVIELGALCVQTLTNSRQDVNHLKDVRMS